MTLDMNKQGNVFIMLQTNFYVAVPLVYYKIDMWKKINTPFKVCLLKGS